MQIMSQEQWYTTMWNLMDSEFRYACACKSRRHATFSYMPLVCCKSLCPCAQRSGLLVQSSCSACRLAAVLTAGRLHARSCSFNHHAVCSCRLHGHHGNWPILLLECVA